MRLLEVLTADVEAPTISSHVSFGHAILIRSTSRKEKGAWDRVELFTAPAGKGRKKNPSSEGK